MAGKTQLPIVPITGIGVFAPVIGIIGEFFKIGMLSTGTTALFGFTMVYFVVRIIANKRWEAGKKIGWLAALFGPLLIFPPISWVVAVYFWWTEIREDKKWSDLAA